jgi:hypothetical protein
MKLTKGSIAGINLSTMAVLAPVMIELSQHLPARYLWIAPILVQAANWLISHKALKTSNPDLITRKQMKCLYEIGFERRVDVSLRAHERFGKDIAELRPYEASILIKELKKKIESQAVTRPLEGGRDAQQ